MLSRYSCFAMSKLPRKYAELFLTQVSLKKRIFPRNDVTRGNKKNHFTVALFFMNEAFVK
jgi:hypothetical protein